MTGAYPRTIHNDWPPPSVVGASPWPYPAERAGRESISDAMDRIAGQRSRSGVVELPAGQLLAVRPSWLNVPLFTRTGAEGWALHEEGVQRIAAAAARLGLHEQMPERYGWFDAEQFRRHLEAALSEYLRALAWWEPDAVPRASGALESVFAQLINDGWWTWEVSFPGEREAQEARRLRRDDEGSPPWRDRIGRREIELMIAASGRVDPYRLRPLVLITENAGRKQWWYGGWGVYDVDAAGAVGSLLAIYGKHARFAYTVVWMTASDYKGPQPSDDDIRWYGHSFDDWGDRHADVLCAITGASLYDGTRGRIADAPRLEEAFVTGTPETLTTLGEHGDVLERIDGPPSHGSDAGALPLALSASEMTMPVGASE